MLRLRGLSLTHMNAGAPTDATWESLNRALSTARAQAARWLELRVALTICQVAGGQRCAELESILGALDAEHCADVRIARSFLAGIGV